MLISAVSSVISRKIRPIHPGEVATDILRELGIVDIKSYSGFNYRLRETLEGERPMTYSMAGDLQYRLGVSAKLLMDMQRKVDIWDSSYE
jgi:plasmid maintenance system antidote protein VapI